MAETVRFYGEDYSAERFGELLKAIQVKCGTVTISNHASGMYYAEAECHVIGNRTVRCGYAAWGALVNLALACAVGNDPTPPPRGDAAGESLCAAGHWEYPSDGAEPPEDGSTIIVQFAHQLGAVFTAWYDVHLDKWGVDGSNDASGEFAAFARINPPDQERIKEKRDG